MWHFVVYSYCDKLLAFQSKRVCWKAPFRVKGTLDLYSIQAFDTHTRGDFQHSSELLKGSLCWWELFYHGADARRDTSLTRASPTRWGASRWSRTTATATRAAPSTTSATNSDSATATWVACFPPQTRLLSMTNSCRQPLKVFNLSKHFFQSCVIFSCSKIPKQAEIVKKDQNPPI